MLQVIKFFITPVYPYGNDHYYHEMIAVAEGFKELGYKVIGNCNYWWMPEKNEFLLKEDIEGDYDIAIYCRRYVLSFEHLLFRKGYPNFKLDKINILNDRNDFLSPIWLNPHYQIFDLILAGSMVKGLKVPSNVRPWAIGLTNRVMNVVDKYFDEEKDIEPIIGYNYRVGHNLRSYINENLLKLSHKYPYQSKFSTIQSNDTAEDIYYFKSSTKRHVPDYYKTLNECLMFSTFCGYIEYLPKIYQPYNMLDKLRRKPFAILNKMTSDKSRFQFVFQHDSFRTWETFYARACPINLDYEDWGLILPEMPINGVHYIGMKRFDFKSFIEKIESMDINDIEQIGLKGKEWVAEHYSPKAQTNRILNYLKEMGKLK